MVQWVAEQVMVLTTWLCVSQCVAVCCSVLQCLAVCCSVLQCVAACCSVLHCVALCRNVLQSPVVSYNVLQCVAVYCSLLQRVMTHRDMTQSTHQRCSVPEVSASHLTNILVERVALCCSVLQCVAVCHDA